jgi:hypothetical protein
MRVQTVDYGATEMGWLRRSELDTPGVYVWEMPSGALFAHASRGEPVVTILAELPGNKNKN